MTTIELNARRSEIMEMLAEVSDEKIFDKIAALIRKKRKNNPLDRISPFTCTREELIAAIEESEEDYKAGRFITHAEMKKKVASWGRQ